MALAIDELSADVEAPAERREPEAPPRPASPPPSELRRQGEQIVRATHRALRVRAD
jgi:hypothetical protein